MTTHPDFEELFRFLEKRTVEYMAAGDYAAAFHGYPRFTKDIDIFFNATPENIARLLMALVDFCFDQADLSEKDFAKAGNILSFGVHRRALTFLMESTV